MFVEESHPSSYSNVVQKCRKKTGSFAIRKRGIKKQVTIGIVFQNKKDKVYLFFKEKGEL